MPQVTMTVRTDAELKSVFTSLCEEFGMSANTAMNIFMRAVAETKSIPFTIGKKQKDIRQEFGDMLTQVLEENRKLDRPDLTIDEINAEIAAARAERKTKTDSSTL